MSINKKKIQLNKKNINERNYRILLVTLIAVLFIYIFSIPISLIVEDYKVMFIPYLIIIAVLAIVLLLHKLLKKHTLVFTYKFLIIYFFIFSIFKYSSSTKYGLYNNFIFLLFNSNGCPRI